MVKLQMKVLSTKTGGPHWWARMDDGKTRNSEIWAPIGKISMSPAEALKCAQMARWYWSAGILCAITVPIVKVIQDGTEERMEYLHVKCEPGPYDKRSVA